MKKALKFLFVLSMMVSCNNIQNQTHQDSLLESHQFTEGLVDTIIERKDKKHIEFMELYDSLITEISIDKFEKSHTAEALKRRGFQVIDWGRGNHLNGPRVVCLTLQKNDCICEIRKFYNSRTKDSFYDIHESIQCMDSMTYYKQ